LDEISKFENLEEEILSRSRPKSWGKLELGVICYQISSAIKADHFEINSPETVAAFISAVKNKKNIQLCVYQETNIQRKKTLYGSSVIGNEGESNLKGMESVAIVQAKEKIYKNLKQCSYHIQGCLLSSDGRHLKLTGEMVTMWAIAMV
jgi:hypothetical protein